jgi:hypothetical protein
VVEAATGNWGYGKEIMALLLDRRGGDVPITKGVVEAAAGPDWGGVFVQPNKFGRLVSAKRWMLKHFLSDFAGG